MYQSNSRYKPLTGAVDYRDALVDPQAYEDEPRRGRTEFSGFSGNVDSMQMRAGLGDFRAPMRAGKAMFDQRNLSGPDAKRTRLPGDLSEQELNVLLSRDIVIMQDRSGSMGEKEHFPQGTFPRWYWCLSQAMDFTRQAARLPNWSFTLVLFSNEFDVYRNVRLQNVPAIYDTRRGAYVGTKLANPMSEQIYDYFQRRAAGSRRPLMIAVVTDGKPQDDEKLRDLIIDTTHHMRRPDDIQIVFLQVGTDDEGQRKLRRLDYKLQKKGARYDIVSVMPFDWVTRVGLTRALVSAIQGVDQ